MRRRLAKILALFSCAAVMILVALHENFGQMFFVNRTASMPTGVYLKSRPSKLQIGDIIVFKIENKSIKLIKYIAAMRDDEVCHDHNSSLWVNGDFVAHKSIEKFSANAPTQSSCQKLAEDEILVLGEHPDSYDSRYFGPIKVDQVIAQVELLFGQRF